MNGRTKKKGGESEIRLHRRLEKVDDEIGTYDVARRKKPVGGMRVYEKVRHSIKGTQGIQGRLEENGNRGHEDVR